MEAIVLATAMLVLGVWSQEQPKQPGLSNKILKEAVSLYCTNPTMAEAQFGPIEKWDVSAITSMAGLFYYRKKCSPDPEWACKVQCYRRPEWCKARNMKCCTGAEKHAEDNAADMYKKCNPNLSGWDTSEVTSMTAMFKQASAFNQKLFFNTSKVTTMKDMFYAAVAFNQKVSFDTSKVTTMKGMFKQARAFDKELSFDTSQVTDMCEMFFGATVFNQKLSFDTSEVTDMSNMFAWALAFNQPLFFDTSRVTTMGMMFYSANAFNQTLYFDISLVRDKNKVLAGSIAKLSPTTSARAPLIVSGSLSLSAKCWVVAAMFAVLTVVFP